MKADSIDQRIQAAATMLSEYVTFGAMRHANQFDERFGAVAALLPESFRRPPAIGWRALVLPADAYRRLREEGHLDLPGRQFASWSGDLQAGMRCLRDRCLRMGADEVGVLISKPLLGEAMVADVRAVYRHLQWNCADVEEWRLYVEWEHELIMHNSPALLSVATADVVFEQPRLDNFRARSVARCGVMRPYPGEFAWDEGADSGFVIGVVSGQQSGISDGLWQVGVAGDEVGLTIRFELGEWVTVAQSPRKRHGP